MWLLLACSVGSVESGGGEAVLDLPGHNECLPEGEEMTAEVCLAVVKEAGRQPTVSEDKSGLDTDPDDPRADDRELVWLTAEVNRCACRCCHTASWGGAGVYFWDLEFRPVWTDSARLWSLGVFAGLTEETEQTLPTGDIERVRGWLERERERRGGEEAYE